MPETTLQNQLLNELRKEKLKADIYLVNGVKLHGTIVAFDTFSVLLSYNGQLQLIYKSAISTIAPLQAVNLKYTPREEV